MTSRPPREPEAVLKLDGPARYQHFVKRVADWEEAWGLWNSGWALMGDSNGELVPLWPHREYAEACRTTSWARHEPRRIELADLLAAFLPDLGGRDLRVAVFPTPARKGVVVTAQELEASLREELTNYEEP